ncbi:MAG TPA: hypothetical protein VFQ40_06175 [Actinomycetota bacterium]|nr:hypothetical protein [Actinomycetota bacterium]
MAHLEIGSRDDPMDVPADATWRQSIATLSSAIGLTPPKKARGALIQALSQGVRFTLNGDNPTGAEGFPLAANDTLVVHGQLSQIKFIEQAASAALRVHYFR